jgi:hypothetical protein
MNIIVIYDIKKYLFNKKNIHNLQNCHSSESKNKQTSKQIYIQKKRQ